MKKAIIILTAIIGLWSCNSQTDKAGNSVDSLQTAGANIKRTDIYIKDQSQYDSSFIHGLSEYIEPIKLIDNYIITGKDTTYFPDDLPLNKEMVFNAAKDKNKYELTVTRINLTTIAYKFIQTGKDHKTMISRSGNAVLGSMFFLASEVPEDEISGSGYGCSEYWDKTTDCWFSICIGIGLDDNGKKRATLSSNCEGKNNQTMSIKDCPTLRTK
jgi:hypothetical protein